MSRVACLSIDRIKIRTALLSGDSDEPSWLLTSGPHVVVINLHKHELPWPCLDDSPCVMNFTDVIMQQSGRKRSIAPELCEG